MLVCDLLNNCEFQCEVRYFVYDYEQNERLECCYDVVKDRRVKYLYVEKDYLCVEVDDE